MPPQDNRTDSTRRHILTVVVEDYFQHSGFSRVIRPGRWKRFENRIESNTIRALDLLDGFDVKATFFTLGWVAEEMPEVVRAISDRGHEVATKGFLHRTLKEMTREGFRDDVVRSREVIQKACGRKVFGHRIARGTFGTDDTWALDILAEEGFAYDSSIYPRLRLIAGEPWRRFEHVHKHGEIEIRELPLPSMGPSWFTIPVAGGNYFRQVPRGVADRIVSHWERKTDSPFVMYFHVWELDPDLPRIEAVGRFERIRQYRNLDQMMDRMSYCLGAHSWESAADHLGLDRTAPLDDAVVDGESAPTAVGSADTSTPADDVQGRVERTPVTLVVPVYNEELAIPYLSNTLSEVDGSLSEKYEISLLFVDDGSSDNTWESLHRYFDKVPRCRILRHDKNKGVAEAILTGIRAAETEIVCSIDCDCTYDPRQLRTMIPMLEEGVDMVTASPYHALGSVLNVPAWRLSLSKGLSFLYRRIFRNRLATYTACFRVYRRSAMEDVSVTMGGFLGVAETLGILDRRGSRIVECPAVLEVRMLGHSKMKVLRTILGHLKLLAYFAFRRRATTDMTA